MTDFVTVAQALASPSLDTEIQAKQAAPNDPDVDWPTLNGVPIYARTIDSRLILGTVANRVVTTTTTSSGTGLSPAQADLLNRIPLIENQLAEIEAPRHPYRHVFESPSLENVFYTFYANEDVPIDQIISFTGGKVDRELDGKIKFLITPWDSQGLSTWIWGFNSAAVAYDLSVAKFWGNDPDYPQRVIVGRCEYIAANDATLSQKQVRPNLGVVGEKLNGWIRMPDRVPADIPG